MSQADRPAKPVGTNIDVHEEANGAYTLYIGEGVKSGLAARMAAVCDSDDEACETSIQEILMNAGYGVKARAVGLFLAIGGIFLAAFAYQIRQLYFDNARVVPDTVTIQAPQASEIEQYPDATAVVLQAASNGPGIEVAISPIPSGAAIGTLSAAGTGTIAVNPSTINVTPVAIKTITAGYLAKFTTEGSSNHFLFDMY